MAEGVGFEPTNELPHCWFSRPVLLTAQPPFQNLVISGLYYIYYEIYTTTKFIYIIIEAYKSITMINDLNRLNKFHRNIN